MWDPDANIPDNPFTPPERRDVRRVVRWYERREYLRSGLKSWVLWVIGLPTMMLAIWQIIQIVTWHIQ
jgi:hypothetical protein